MSKPDEVLAEPGEREEPSGSEAGAFSDAELAAALTPAAEERPQRASPLSGLRAFSRAVQHVIALGLLALIVASLLQFVITTRVLMPWFFSGGGWGQGAGWEILAALTEQVGLILSLPALAWVLGWIFADRPVRLALWSSVLAQAAVVGVTYLSEGVEAVLFSPVEVAVRLAVVALTTTLGALAYRDARDRLAAREAAHRRGPAPEAPASDAGGEGA